MRANDRRIIKESAQKVLLVLKGSRPHHVLQTSYFLLLVVPIYLDDGPTGSLELDMDLD